MLAKSLKAVNCYIFVISGMPVTEKQLKELEDFFAKTTLLTSVQLDVGSKAENVSKFIVSHLKVLRNNGDKPMYEVFYLRLLRMKEIIAGQ